MLAVDGRQPDDALLSGIHSHGEIHVQQYGIHMLALEGGQDRVRRGKCEDAPKHICQADLHGGENGRIVVNDKYGMVIRFHVAKILFFALQPFKNACKSGVHCRKVYDFHTARCVIFLQSACGERKTLCDCRSNTYLCIKNEQRR